MTIIDPNTRWGLTGRPGFAGLLTFAGQPYTESASDLADFDVAIIGAPMDELVADHPGTRFGPRAIRNASGAVERTAAGGAGMHLDVGIEAFEEIRVADYGDAAVIPAVPVASHAAIEKVVGEALDAKTIPIILGGDHSIAEPDIRACALRHGPVGLIHIDAHTDTAKEVWGAEISQGTPMYRLIEQGHIDPKRYAQVGLRGYWPGEDDFVWQRERGIKDFRMNEIIERGIAAVVADAIEAIGTGPVFASIDIDVLDPAYAPGTGTPEPGGMTSADLLWACREFATKLELVGADVVEVIPSGLASPDITALTGARIVRDLLTGIALRSRARAQ